MCRVLNVSFFSTTFVRNFLVPINSSLVTFEMRVETQEGCRVKCPLLLSDFDQNWNVVTNFSKTPLYQIL
jgi:hypothetical protein